MSAFAPKARWVLPLLLGSTVLFGSLGAKKSPKVKTADRYELVDEQGEVRGVLGTWADSPYLRLQDDEGSGVMVLTQGGEVSMSMYTKGPRHPRVHVLTGEAGSTFTLLDRNGQASVRIELDADGRVTSLEERPDASMARADTALRGLWDTSPR